VPETVGPGGIVVDYGDWNTMKENILRLLDNPSLRKKMGQSALKHSHQYSDDVVADKVFNLYEKFV